MRAPGRRHTLVSTRCPWGCVADDAALSLEAMYPDFQWAAVAQSNTEFSSVVCILMQGYSVRVRGPMHHPSVQCACVRTLSRVWSVAPSMWFSQVSPTCRHRAHRDVLRSGHSAGAAAVGQLRDRGERGGAQAGGRGAAAAARRHGSDR